MNDALLKFYSCIIVLYVIIAFASCSNEQYDDVYYKVIAHRGCWDDEESAQNSLASLYRAIVVGVDGVELDVCKTVDDSLVVAHGIEHGEYVISETEFDVLREVKLSNGESLPTLFEYISFYNENECSLELIIELKQSEEEEPVIDMLEKFNMISKVKLVSFGWTICTNLKSINPNIHVSYLDGDKTPHEIKEAGLDGIAYNIGVYMNNPIWLEDSRTLGLTTNVWTINTDSDLIWCAQNKLDYIVTDSPQKAFRLRKHY